MSIKWYQGITVPIDPDSVIDYRWDFVDWLSTGDSLSSHTVSADSGITVDSSAIATTGVNVVLSGATIVGTKYAVTVHVVTNSGYETDRTVLFRTVER